MEPTNFRHPDRWNTIAVPERVGRRALENVDVQDDGCWISRYSVASHGYAQIGWSVRKRGQTSGPRIQMVLAHRAAWTAVHGQVPVGMTIDHTCKVRRCVNPKHLRLMPNYENARRTGGRDWPIGQCVNGHSDELLVPVSGLRNKSGMPREGKGCGPCYKVYAARWTWKIHHPGEPYPERLLLASERKENLND